MYPPADEDVVLSRSDVAVVDEGSPSLTLVCADVPVAYEDPVLSRPDVAVDSVNVLCPVEAGVDSLPVPKNHTAPIQMWCTSPGTSRDNLSPNFRSDI